VKFTSQPSFLTARVVAVLAVVLTAAWVWACFCLYPSHDWNAMRLAPSFMLRAGLSPYPGPTAGPVTTWIYGPVPILLQLPATLARGIVGALLTAGLINLAIALVPLWFAVKTYLSPAAARSAWLWAGLLATAAWPATQLIFIQADNGAVAFGLLAGVALLSAGPRDTRRLWLGALALALTLWSKQTEIGPLLAALAYLLIRHGPRAAFDQAVRCVAVGALLGVLLLPLCGAEGLLYNMFVLPRGFPWTDLVAKAVHPIYRNYFLAQCVLPTVIVIVAARRIFRRDSPFLLPGLMFIFSLPFNLAGFATIGGNINSLHGGLYLLPAVAAALVARPGPRSRGLPLVAVLVWSGLLLLQCAAQRPLSFAPDVTALRQAESLARQLPCEIYFPWNPLLTYYADGRIDHAEDGLLTRRVAGRPVPAAVLRQYLPPRFCVVAFHRLVNDGIVKSLIPADAQCAVFGEWILYSWPPPGPP